MPQMVLFMTVLDEYIESVRVAYSKPAGNNWPARGRQIMSSYIRLAAMKQFDLVEKARKQFSKKEVAEMFWSTTQIRYTITGEFVVGLKLCERDYKSPSLSQIVDSTEYLLSLLKEKTVEDSFCLNGKNNILSKEKVAEIVSSGKLTPENNSSAKMLSVALASFSWAYGFDTHFSNFMDIEGPYFVGEGMQLLVREFNFSNLGLVWENIPRVPKRVRIYLLYKNSDISLDWELHTQTKSEFDLAKCAVVSVANRAERLMSAEEINSLIELAANSTQKQVEFVNSLPVLDKIRKGALLSFLQVKGVADALGEDWKPSKEVEAAILQKGEGVWFGRNSPPQKQKSSPASADDWLATFDPRIPRE